MEHATGMWSFIHNALEFLDKEFWHDLEYCAKNLLKHVQMKVCCDFNINYKLTRI